MIQKWCKDHSTTYDYEDMIKTLAQYVSGMDGSTLTKADGKALHRMYEINPEIISLLCNAFEDKGYESF